MSREEPDISVGPATPPPPGADPVARKAAKVKAAAARQAEAAEILEGAQITPPGRFLVRMGLFLGIVVLVAAVLGRDLIPVVQANPALNGLILGVLLIGILYALRQVLELRPEVEWIRAFRVRDPGLSLDRPPRLLAPMAQMLADRKGEVSLSATSLRTLLDGIDTRLVERREISRYLIGLLVFLGLLGTFWGLLRTVASVGETIQGLGVAGDDYAALFGQLQAGLEGPLSGMGLAFSSSLLGLAGSLVLGFLDLQAGQAQNRFYNDLEEWLSGFTKLSSGLGGAAADGEGSVPAYVAALLENTAESLDQLQRTMGRGDASSQRATQALEQVAGQMSALTDQLRQDRTLIAQMVEQQSEIRGALQTLAEASRAEGGSEQTVAVHARNIDARIAHLADDLRAGRESLVQELRADIKLLARTIANLDTGGGR